MTTNTSFTVLFQGDSITDGTRSREGDPSLCLGQGYPYLIAARLGEELAGRPLRFVNRGISGNRVSDLYARWNEDTISVKPDVVSILIGVNDAWRIVEELPTGATDRFERAYRHLLEETREVLPNAAIVLCEPFILKTGVTEARWERWQSRVAAYGRTTRKLAEEYGTLFVPLQEAFDRAAERAEPAYWIWDGVHPTAAGHQIIAREWLAAVQSATPALRA
ncbi:SGNH/GDSL hydrolase family protein [Cohnella sp. AR92]|uniref:SGNH/GDSL hydrolase family protein n=1 Tax=Cohnella sp. AR92 TaxID=648716 RepID=UPI000F8C9422|nr:SGNH/GDSL hydrolase family protein [Cohnella sp. AR92]RUS46701.1 lysophospholipase [Cohnella sp. AR92]